MVHFKVQCKLEMLHENVLYEMNKYKTFNADTSNNTNHVGKNQTFQKRILNFTLLCMIRVALSLMTSTLRRKTTTKKKEHGLGQTDRHRL